MRVLIYVPQARNLYDSLSSVMLLKTDGHDVSRWFDAENNSPYGDPHHEFGERFEAWYNAHAAKLERARQIALRDGYDALMTVEDDIIVPPNALLELAALDVPIAYGLAVWRNAPHKWSATLNMEWNKCVDTLDDDEVVRKVLWGTAIDTLGCGFFCTLIRREAFEQIAFVRRLPAAADWELALRARELGLRQVSHLGVVCGHIDAERGRIYWPDPEAGWREEER